MTRIIIEERLLRFNYYRGLIRFSYYYSIENIACIITNNYLIRFIDSDSIFRLEHYIIDLVMKDNAKELYNEATKHE